MVRTINHWTSKTGRKRKIRPRKNPRRPFQPITDVSVVVDKIKTPKVTEKSREREFESETKWVSDVL